MFKCSTKIPFLFTTGWLLSRKHGGKMLPDDFCSWFLHRTYVYSFTSSPSFTLRFTCFKSVFHTSFIHTVISHRPSHILSYSVVYFCCFCLFVWPKFLKTCLPSGPGFTLCHKYWVGLIPVALWPFTWKLYWLRVMSCLLNKVKLVFDTIIFLWIIVVILVTARKDGIHCNQGFINQAHRCHEQPADLCTCGVFFVCTAATALNLLLNCKMTKCYWFYL